MISNAEDVKSTDSLQEWLFPFERTKERPRLLRDFISKAEQRYSIALRPNSVGIDFTVGSGYRRMNDKIVFTEAAHAFLNFSFGKTRVLAY